MDDEYSRSERTRGVKTDYFLIFCRREYRLRLTDARLWLAVAVICWMCLFQVRYFIT